MTLAFWYRRKYNLTPLDSRFLDMTPDDIRLEYETYMAYEDTDKDSIESDDADSYFAEYQAFIARKNEQEELYARIKDQNNVD